MSNDEIIEMARQVGVNATGNEYWPFFIEELEAFAKLIAAKEREAIIDLVAMYGGPVDLEAAIRARAQADRGEA